jgi:formyl-CoA transferase
VQHLGIAVQVPDRDGGGLTLVGQPFELSRTPAQFNSLLGDAGADNDELLKSLDYDQAEIDALRQKRVI